MESQDDEESDYHTLISLQPTGRQRDATKQKLTQVEAIPTTVRKRLRRIQSVGGCFSSSGFKEAVHPVLIHSRTAVRSQIGENVETTPSTSTVVTNPASQPTPYWEAAVTPRLQPTPSREAAVGAVVQTFIHRGPSGRGYRLQRRSPVRAQSPALSGESGRFNIIAFVIDTGFI